MCTLKPEQISSYSLRKFVMLCEKPSRTVRVWREHRSSDKRFETNSKAALPRLEHLSASSTPHVLNETINNLTGQCTHNAY